MSDFVCINGIYKPRSEAVVSIEDRGFLFGDGVFETLRFACQKPYLWEPHYRRLTSGLEAIHIPVPPKDELLEQILTLVARNGGGECMIRISVTRGIGSCGYMPSNNSDPTVVLETRKLPEPCDTVSLWQSTFARILPNQLPTQYKLMQGMQSTLALIEAAEHACNDALLLTPEGLISECASSNIFWFKDEVLYTPSLTTGCLGGTTRERLIELSPYPVDVVSAGLEALRLAEEVFISNAARLVTPVSFILPLDIRYTSSSIANQMRQLLVSDIQSQ